VKISFLIRSAFCFILLFVILFGCVPSKPAYEEQILPAERLIKQLEKNRRKIKTFRGTGRMTIDSPEFGANANFEVLLRKPDSIKISIYGPFGIDLAQALVTKNSFIFHDVIRNNVYKGKNKDTVLEKIFKVNFSFDDLMDAFAGAVNFTDNLRREPDNYKLDSDSYFLTYNDSVASRKSDYTIKIENLALTNFYLKNFAGEEIFKGDYSDFRLFENVPIPYKTKVVNGNKNQSIDIEYRTIEVNKEIEGFTIDIPKDATIIKW
jgi:outer membrane lipoprotein-sorting protein